MRWKRDHWNAITARAKTIGPEGIDPIRLIRHVVLKSIGVPTSEEDLAQLATSLEASLGDVSV